MILKKNNNAVKKIVVGISIGCMFVLSNGVEGKESIAVDKEKNSTLSFDIEEALNMKRYDFIESNTKKTLFNQIVSGKDFFQYGVVPYSSKSDFFISEISETAMKSIFLKETGREYEQNKKSFVVNNNPENKESVGQEKFFIIVQGSGKERFTKYSFTLTDMEQNENTGNITVFLKTNQIKSEEFHNFEMNFVIFSVYSEKDSPLVEWKVL